MMTNRTSRWRDDAANLSQSRRWAFLKTFSGCGCAGDAGGETATIEAVAADGSDAGDVGGGGGGGDGVGDGAV